MEPLKGHGGGKNMGWEEKKHFSKRLRSLKKLVSSEKHFLFMVSVSAQDVNSGAVQSVLF